MTVKIDWTKQSRTVLITDVLRVIRYLAFKRVQVHLIIPYDLWNTVTAALSSAELVYVFMSTPTGGTLKLPNPNNGHGAGDGFPGQDFFG